LDGANADVLMIPSVGIYSGKYTARFEGSVENTITYIFKELVKCGIDEIYADVSTGQNIYTTSMLEALRKYATYRKLRYILQGRSGISLKLAYVPPVFVEGQEANVEIHDFDVKAFFSLPSPNPKKICVEKRKELQRKHKKFFDSLSNDLKTLKIAFNAIKYNTPLVFYHPEILDLDIDVGRDIDGLIRILEELEESREIVMDENGITVSRAVINSDDVTNTFFAIAILSSIIDFHRVKIREPEVNEIFKTFKKIYENLGLDVNSKFLERDIDDIKKLTANLTGEKLLLDLYAERFGHIKEDQKPKGSSRPDRNFFAHSGFLKEITRVRKEEGKILLRYDLELIKKKRDIGITKWLQNPRKS